MILQESSKIYKHNINNRVKFYYFKNTIPLLFLLLNLNAIAQVLSSKPIYNKSICKVKITSANSKDTIFYLNQENKLLINTDSCTDCKKILVKTSKGYLHRVKNEYYFKSSREGITEITLFKIVDSDTLLACKQSFSVIKKPSIFKRATKPNLTDKKEKTEIIINKTNELKLYSNFLFQKNITEKIDWNSGDRLSAKTIDLGKLSLGLTLMDTKGNNHEFEINQLGFSEKESENLTIYKKDSFYELYTMKSKSYKFGFSYEYQYLLKKKNNMLPYLGISINPFIFYERVVPINPNIFETRSANTGFYLSVVPRLIINTKKRIFFDISSIISVYSTIFEKYRLFNPTLPNHLQIQTDFNSKFLPMHYLLRIGIGVRL
jgi:hypothetical protein